MKEFAAIVESLMDLVVQDIELRPVSGSDGIWRFDRVIRDGLTDAFEGRDPPARADYTEMGRIARSMPRGYESWSPEMIVAAYMESRAAYMTPGFAEARWNSLYGN